MLNLKRMQEEWQSLGYDYKQIADMIGMNPKSLKRKLDGKRTTELTATQANIICELVNRPIDMFIMRTKEA